MMKMKMMKSWSLNTRSGKCCERVWWLCYCFDHKSLLRSILINQCMFYINHKRAIRGFLPHSVNLIHHLSPPSHHPSLPLSSSPDLKLTCSTNSSHHRSSPTHRTAHWTSTGLPSRTPYHYALCFSSSVIFF